jgi:hypothetical protein
MALKQASETMITATDGGTEIAINRISGHMRYASRYNNSYGSGWSVAAGECHVADKPAF